MLKELYDTDACMQICKRFLITWGEFSIR